MAKLTKKSYQRKAMVLGGIVFASCALFATGFAAFVVSASATSGVGGSVSVGTISDKAITIESKLSTDKIVFDAKQDDNTGRVRWDGTNFANLETHVSGTFKPSSYVNVFTVNLRMGTVAEDGKTINIDSEAEARMEAAAKAQYIVLPTCFGEGNAQKLEFGTEQLKEDGSNDTATFNYDITFAWGEHFKGQNPSEYYDTKEGKDSYPDEGENSYLADLKDFYLTMTGKPAPSDEEAGSIPAQNFVVVLKADTSGTRQ